MHVIIEFLHTYGFKLVEIHKHLDSVHGTGLISEPVVKRWVHKFKTSLTTRLASAAQECLNHYRVKWDNFFKSVVPGCMILFQKKSKKQTF